MVLVIFVDGFSKKEAPGSLFSPAPTELVVTNVQELGMAFGLFMAGVRTSVVVMQDIILILDAVLWPCCHTVYSKRHG